MTDTAMTPGAGFSRWQASGMHLLISAAIAVVAFVIILGVWYPPPLFKAEGGNDLLLILIAVDVVIGPLITLVIFKSGKPGLRFDLSVIALLQAAALVYGCYVMFVARPVYIVLVLDQFETVRANDLDAADVTQAVHPGYRSLPLSGPQHAAIDFPTNMKALKSLITEAQTSGKVVTHLPRFYVPYADHKAKALAQSQPVAKLLQRDAGMAQQLETQIAASGRKAAELNFLPLQTRRGWGAVLMDAKSGEIVKLLPPPGL